MTIRILLGIAALGLATVTASAQNPILNPGFENWTAGDPLDWTTSNEGIAGSVTQTADVHSGSWAVRGDVVELFPGFNYQPMIMSGDSSEGFPTTVRWDAFQGYYKLNAVGGDQILITVAMVNEQGAIGGGSMFLSTPASTYTQFTVPIFYSVEDTPDSMYIYAVMMGPGLEGQPPHLGSYFQFDDFTMSQDAPPVCPITLTGDVNHTGDRVTSDIIYLVNYVLKGGASPLPCLAAGDVNCDHNVATSDIIYMVNFVLKAGAAPCDVCTMIPGTWSCP